MSVLSNSLNVHNQNHQIQDIGKNELSGTSSTSRDPTAEKVKRFVLGFFAVLLAGIPFIHEGFRKYVFEGPEKTSGVAKTINSVSINKLANKNISASKPKETSTKTSSDIQAQVEAYNLSKIKEKLEGPTLNTAGLNKLPEKIEDKKKQDKVLKALTTLKPEKPVNTKNPLKAENCNLKDFLSALPKFENKEKEAYLIFDIFLISMLPSAGNAFEEVLGQERHGETSEHMSPYEKLINNELKEKGIDYTSEMKEMAAMLYPLALLACFFDPRADKCRPPDERALEHDLTVFMNEYESQFGENFGAPIWTRDFMEQCLEKVWEKEDSDSDSSDDSI